MMKINVLFFVSCWLFIAGQSQAQDQVWSETTPGIISPVTFENEVKMDLATMNDGKIGALQVNEDANIAGSLGVGGAPTASRVTMYGGLNMKFDAQETYYNFNVAEGGFAYFERLGGTNRLDIMTDRVRTGTLQLANTLLLPNTWQVSTPTATELTIAHGGTSVFNLFATNGGQVALGTTNVPEGFRMSINGKLVVEEMLVDLEADWPDYVFEEDYALMPLAELQAYVRMHGHLPNIPSAQQVKADGGVYVGSMHQKLLEKIEELTLYTLEQEQKLSELSEKLKQYENLEAEVEALKKMMATLKED
ncbi:MAG: hypothetical protein ACFB0B_18125 [Thermonemataceae bacterium]